MIQYNFLLPFPFKMMSKEIIKLEKKLIKKLRL